MRGSSERDRQVVFSDTWGMGLDGIINYGVRLIMNKIMCAAMVKIKDIINKIFLTS